MVNQNEKENTKIENVQEFIEYLEKPENMLGLKVLCAGQGGMDGFFGVAPEGSSGPEIGFRLGGREGATLEQTPVQFEFDDERIDMPKTGEPLPERLTNLDPSVWQAVAEYIDGVAERLEKQNDKWVLKDTGPHGGEVAFIDDLLKKE
jgi:hypothetical protein